jgi:hypothetical protein
MKEAQVRVSPKVARKVMSVERQLAQLGVEVDRGHRKAKSAQAFEMVKTAWLLYSIAKEAVGRWPAIREILKKAGLSRYEITTLNLSPYTRKRPAKAKKKGEERKV